MDTPQTVLRITLATALAPFLIWQAWDVLL